MDRGVGSPLCPVPVQSREGDILSIAGENQARTYWIFFTHPDAINPPPPLEKEGQAMISAHYGITELPELFANKYVWTPTCRRKPVAWRSKCRRC